MLCPNSIPLSTLLSKTAARWTFSNTPLPPKGSTRACTSACMHAGRHDTQLCTTSVTNTRAHNNSAGVWSTSNTGEAGQLAKQWHTQYTPTLLPKKGNNKTYIASVCQQLTGTTSVSVEVASPSTDRPARYQQSQGTPWQTEFKPNPSSKPQPQHQHQPKPWEGTASKPPATAWLSSESVRNNQKPSVVMTHTQHTVHICGYEPQTIPLC